MRIGARQLVAHASFRVDKGMRIGLVGRNGAGKTTTMRLLAGEADRGGAAERRLAPRGATEVADKVPP